MLTICVVMATFSMSWGLVGVRSGGSGSCWSPCLGVSPGRLFFFSLLVGGCRRDCDQPGLTFTAINNRERAIAKSEYDRLNLIVSTPEGHKRGRSAPTTYRLASQLIRLRGFQSCDAGAATRVYH